ncbi:MAG: RNA 2',3'-cyclic phosphodiesterase [Coriobacteriia bacterium]|nr:RNA 2',3'-cyclic phosphodiesterase [Coriobacteriia bacterium]
MRAFVGIELSPTVRDALAAAGHDIRTQAPGWAGEKWVAPGNLHVTLAFFGSIESRAVELLLGELDERVGVVSEFELPLVGIIAVPNRDRVDMLWATLDDPVGLAASLAAAVNEAAAACGLAQESRRYVPHITLARTRRAHRHEEGLVEVLDAASASLPTTVSVVSATLFSSVLSRSGPRYEVVRSWPLRS